MTGLGLLKMPSFQESLRYSDFGSGIFIIGFANAMGRTAGRMGKLEKLKEVPNGPSLFPHIWTSASAVISILYLCRCTM